jgi:hypothetical protein
MRHSYLVCLAFVIPALLASCSPKPPADSGGDTRTPVALPPDAVAAVRAEMRTMLLSLHDIHRALVEGDTALAHRAAIASGLAAAADPALEPLLPETFMQWGTQTHAQFDSVGLAIAAGAPVESLQPRLPRLTANCVACHAAYRLVPLDH